MKKIITITILSILGISLATFVFAIPDYERLSKGYFLQNPIKFDITGIAGNSWRLNVYDMDSGYNFGQCRASTTQGVIEETLPLKKYQRVVIQWFGDENCGPIAGSDAAEYDSGNPIFEIIPVQWLPVTNDFTAGIIGYVRAFVGSGMFPFIAMIIGIPFAFVVIRKVIDLVPKK